MRGGYNSCTGRDRQIYIGEAAVEGTTQEDVLRRVLYPKAHGNGIEKKKKKKPSNSFMSWFMSHATLDATKDATKDATLHKGASNGKSSGLSKVVQDASIDKGCFRPAKAGRTRAWQDFGRRACRRVRIL